jgi:hypothetical protein
MYSPLDLNLGAGAHVSIYSLAPCVPPVNIIYGRPLFMLIVVFRERNSRSMTACQVRGLRKTSRVQGGGLMSQSGCSNLPMHALQSRCSSSLAGSASQASNGDVTRVKVVQRGNAFENAWTGLFVSEGRCRTSGLGDCDGGVWTKERDPRNRWCAGRKVHAGHQRESGGRWEANEFEVASKFKPNRFKNSVLSRAGSRHGVSAQSITISGLVGGQIDAGGMERCFRCTTCRFEDSRLM